MTFKMTISMPNFVGVDMDEDETAEAMGKAVAKRLKKKALSGALVDTGELARSIGYRGAKGKGSGTVGPRGSRKGDKISNPALAKAHLNRTGQSILKRDKGDAKTAKRAAKSNIDDQVRKGEVELKSVGRRIIRSK